MAWYGWAYHNLTIALALLNVIVYPQRFIGWVEFKEVLIGGVARAHYFLICSTILV